MLASDDQLLHDDVEQLLAPLGVRLALTAASSSCGFRVWRLSSKQDPSEPALLYTRDAMGVISYGELEQLHRELRSEISKIWVDGHYVANPYLGCRSLEEMQIRCDLLGT